MKYEIKVEQLEKLIEKLEEYVAYLTTYPLLLTIFKRDKFESEIAALKEQREKEKQPSIGTYYKKVEIKSEDDLPKEEGNYFVYTIQGSAFTTFFGATTKEKWNNIYWYLQPIEQQAISLPDDKNFNPQSTQIGNEPQYITNARKQQSGKVKSAEQIKNICINTELYIQNDPNYKACIMSGHFVERFDPLINSLSQFTTQRQELELLGDNIPDKSKFYINPSHEQISIFINGEWKFFFVDQRQEITDEDALLAFEKDFECFESVIKADSLISHDEIEDNKQIELNAWMRAIKWMRDKMR